jgi:hypothetical protein
MQVVQAGIADGDRLLDETTVEDNVQAVAEGVRRALSVDSDASPQLAGNSA